MQKFILSILLGSILGIVGARYLFVNSWLSLIPWGAAGFILGWTSSNKKTAVINGFIYGFFLTFIFMISGYNGAQPVITRIPPFAIIGIIGGTCGVIAAMAGEIAKNIFTKK